MPQSGQGPNLVIKLAGDLQSLLEATPCPVVLDAAPEGVAITHNGHLLLVNREFSRLFGYPSAQCIGREIDSLLTPADRMYETEQVYHMIASEGRSAMETVRLTSKGAAVDVSVLTGLLPLGGQAYGLFHTFRDIGPQKMRVAHLEHTAMHDGLTGLANRSLFLQRMEVALSRMRRRPSCTFSVLFLDLDGFKTINDSLGHGAGDRLLRIVAERLCESVRPQDTVARFGGDEFALLLDGTGSADEAAEIAERVQAAVSQPILDDAGEMMVAASMGIAFVGDYSLSIEEILRQADVAMYHAKGAGKSCHRAYDARMTMLAKAS